MPNDLVSLFTGTNYFKSVEISCQVEDVVSPSLSQSQNPSTQIPRSKRMAQTDQIVREIR
jgi:hypothetical protein